MDVSLFLEGTWALFGGCLEVWRGMLQEFVGGSWMVFGGVFRTRLQRYITTADRTHVNIISCFSIMSLWSAGKGPK